MLFEIISIQLTMGDDESIQSSMSEVSFERSKLDKLLDRVKIRRKAFSRAINLINVIEHEATIVALLC